MSPSPIITGPSWTSEKDGLLRSMAASGESSGAIGKLLNRTASAIRQRARTLQIKLARSRPGPKAKRRVLTKQAERAAQTFGGTARLAKGK
jgi:hypothetical protein